ncbi:tail protein D [Campylobacter hyointestinalis subsp. hyointestinalis]|uniref:Tail protein D n=1 Tax=Campylobacter hyointestinalis subsp. hyointestinalis TaxID=91352 RepID=A0A9W5ETQ3_CAMHY|nr:phage tail protein [Campylobacter hyointestinalis]CUU77389.1 tail protein D [Campylobacter hyointestinalis subsp. hyointestinalis]
MVLTPNFKVVVNDKDITEVIRANLISITYDDKEGDESDEVSIIVHGIYNAPKFGDKIELYLGYSKLYKCGSFALQTVDRDFKAHTTEIRATAVNFADTKTKVKKTRSWENTTLFGIARKIASEQGLGFKSNGEDVSIVSKLQQDMSDIDFIHSLAFDFGFLGCVKNSTLIIGKKADTGTKSSGISGGPKFELDMSELYSFEISEAYRNTYKSVVIEWQESSSGEIKSLRAGSGEPSYKMRIAEPKSDSEAFSRANAKLNDLLKGGVSGKCRVAGANIVCGGSVSFKNSGASDIDGRVFGIKSVSHSLNSSGYSIEVEFER